MKHNPESGNALFYILIAVALLAALSYAVSQSGRGSAKQISDERARLAASEIIEYSNNISAAVTQLKLRGVDTDELCFDDTNWGASDYDHSPACTDDFNKIFHISGAGIIWSSAPSEAMDSAASPDNLWHIYGNNEINNVGTTCGAAGCSDLALYVDELSIQVCQQLNDLIGNTDADTAPPTDTDMGETRYVGAFAYSNTIGDEAGGTAIDGAASGCFQNTTDSKYVFYKVLIAR